MPDQAQATDPLGEARARIAYASQQLDRGNVECALRHAALAIELAQAAPHPAFTYNQKGRGT